jgi:hypothetical protein
MVFHCPICRQPIEVADEQSGDATRCKQCDSLLRVPTNVQVLPPPLPADPRIVTRMARSRRRWRLSATTAVAVLIIAVAVIWYRNSGWISVTPQSQGEVEVKYDRLTGSTVVTIGGMDEPQWRTRTGNGDGNYYDPDPDSTLGVYARFYFHFDGVTLLWRPSMIDLEISRLSDNDAIVLSSRQVYFLIDGGRASADVVASTRHVVTAEIPSNLALSLAKAHSVEVECGEAHLQLTDHQIQSLSNFLSILGFENAGKPG